MKNLSKLLFVLLLLPIAAGAQFLDFCEGDTVTTSDHYSGIIKEIFPDGVVKVLIDGGTYEYNIRQLSKPLSCLRGICTNETVTTSDHYVAVVKQVFPDGLVKVLIDGGTYEYRIGQVFKLLNCLGDICNAQTVTTSDHYNAIVKRVFPDGLVKVLIDGGTYDYNVNQLSQPIECLGQICAHQTVTTSDHYKAVVKQVFPDGLVKVLIDGGTYEYNVNQLYPRQRCSRPDGALCRS